MFLGAKTVCDHWEFKRKLPQGKRNKQTIFLLVQGACSLFPFPAGSRTFCLLYRLACLESITNADISAFDGYQCWTARGLGASRTRKDEMAKFGESNVSNFGNYLI